MLIRDPEEWAAVEELATAIAMVTAIIIWGTLAISLLYLKSRQLYLG